MREGSLKKRLKGLLLTACCLSCCIALPVRADEFTGGSGWKVSFTAGNEMASNFTKADIVDAVSGLQPGDSITFTVGLRNENPETASWYMTNKVISSLEDSSKTNTTSGGAYSYVLTYWNQAGQQDVLFDSDTLGGDGESQAGVGLRAVSSSLGNYFFLDTLATGQEGRITLRITLDGETQGNAYQNTLADLQMNFAVELAPPVVQVDEVVEGDVVSRRTTVVKTSDDTNLVPYFIAMGVSGVLMLGLAAYSLKQGRKEKKEGVGK